MIFHDFFSGGGSEFVTALGLPREKIVDAYLKTDVAEYSEGKIDNLERWRMFTEELGLPEDKVQVCIEAFYRGYAPIQETIAFVQELKRDFPDLRLGVISDQPEGIAGFLREKYKKVFALFDGELVLISTEVGMSKKTENLELYREAVKRAKKPASELLFVDNSSGNIKNAESVGMKGFFFDIENEDVATLVGKLREEIKQQYNFQRF
ncbi:hypothetical protein IH980_01545 [Patescibacteria group bacterium]|nr:hypothetical protein [Patescibacteria group bacterium]